MFLSLASFLIIVLGSDLDARSRGKQPQNNTSLNKNWYFPLMFKKSKVSLQLLWYFTGTDGASLFRPRKSPMYLFMLSSTWAFERYQPPFPMSPHGLRELLELQTSHPHTRCRKEEGKGQGGTFPSASYTSLPAGQHSISTHTRWPEFSRVRVSAVQAGKCHLFTKHTVDPDNTGIVFIRKRRMAIS